MSTVEMIKLIAHALGELNDRAVFVGGATVPFYLPPVFLPQIRPTEDIDVVMEIVGRRTKWINEDALRAKGFTHDTSEGAPICRWVYRNLKVDIMSTDASAFGFTNRWYQEGVDTAIEVETNPVSVKIFSLPYFLGSKIEAFKSRGRDDYRGSTDMEDIIAVLEVAPENLFEGMLLATSKGLQFYLKEEFQKFTLSRDFLDALPGIVFNRTNSHEAARNLIERMKTFSKQL
ncbi:MAG: hypothetical protein ACOYOK_12790 [Pseudobdellovibrionaceae bacterium]